MSISDIEAQVDAARADLRPVEALGIDGPGTDEWPLQVVVLGNSVTLQSVPNKRTKADGTYAELLGRSLRHDGLRAEVVNEGRWYEMVHEGAKRWWTDVRGTSPDVVVLQYGIVEAQPHVVPTWLSRHLFSLTQGSSTVERTYRAKATPLLWKAVRTWQRWAAAHDGLRTARLSEKRFEHELHRLIGMARVDGAMVIVLDHAPPAGKLEHFMPGLVQRWDRHRAAARRAVARYAADDVRFVDVTPIVDDLGVEATVPDGLHLSPEGHRRVAALLASDITTWLAFEAARRARPNRPAELR